MNKVLSIIFFFLTTIGMAVAQDPVVSVRVSQTGYSGEDPDGAGPATGSVTLTFEWMSTQTVQIEAFGLGAAFQTSHLMAAANPNPTALGALAPLGWTIFGNYPGNPVQGGPITINGRPYDQRFIVGFSQAATGTTVPITTSWQPIFQCTYWTKGTSYPQGGYMIMEPYTSVPGHSASTDGGFTEYEYQSPGFPTNGFPLGQDGTVPVSFASFSATCSPNGALLKWATAQESNSDYFEIERSTNGTSWQSIGRTPASGYSSDRREYNQIDLEGGNVLYRIKQVDKDGRTTYTEIVRTNCEVKNVTTLLYPVPAKDYLNVVIKSDKAVRTQLLVFDIKGRLVTRTDANVQNGTNNFRISLNGFSSGDYIIKSTDPDIQLNKKFTVIR